MTDAWLFPGPSDPLPDASARVIADHYGVSRQQVDDWCAAGLPCSSDGLFNPFVVCNWLSSSPSRLAQAPALARRWRTYLSWFRPFVQGQDETRHCRWQRQHRCYLPDVPRQWCWWLPVVPSTPYQRCMEDVVYAAQRCRVGGVPVWRQEGSDHAPAFVQGACRVAISSQRHLSSDDDEYADLLNIAEELVADFTYGYRRHRRDSLSLAASEDGSGSCLDAALTLAERYRSAGRAATIVGGIIANDALANPHFWVEVATRRGPVPVDPSIPAIARMLGEDWRLWLKAYVGGVDARRITLAQGMAPLPGVSPSTFNWSIGELMIRDVAGVWRNAWPCIDWVCGECRGIFTRLDPRQ